MSQQVPKCRCCHRWATTMLTAGIAARLDAGWINRLVGLLYARLADDWLANAASQQRLLATLSMPTCWLMSQYTITRAQILWLSTISGGLGISRSFPWASSLRLQTPVPQQNRRVFNDEVKTPSGIVEEIKDISRLWTAAGARRTPGFSSR